MAICSASTKDACLFVLDNLLGKDNLDKFDLVLAGDDVPRRKPDPMIYSLASEKLGVAPERRVVKSCAAWRWKRTPSFQRQQNIIRIRCSDYMVFLVSCIVHSLFGHVINRAVPCDSS